MDVPAILQAMLDKDGLTQGQLADDLDVDQPQVSRWLKGQTPLADNRDRIAAVARRRGVMEDLRSEEVALTLPSRAPVRTVKLKGYVGAGSEAHFYALSDDSFAEVEAPLSATDQTIAVEIKGTSFGPLMDSWLVYYDDVRSPITDDLINKICVVGLADDRILIKKIKRERDGSYTLLSNSDEKPIKNAAIEWAARVTDMKPR